MVVTAREIYLLVDNAGCPIDNNSPASPALTAPDGQLRYARFVTGPDGSIRSFTIPEYAGLLMLPTSGWLNETYSVEGRSVKNVNARTTREQFHYQFNVVWRSAVVYSDNYVLDKGPDVAFGASEVYDVRFMFTLSNSTDPGDAVRNLNLWIYYPNVTGWWARRYWNASPTPPPPQDYRPCTTSLFPCDVRVTLISALDEDGVVSFTRIPGPRFMNTTWKYVFSANHSAVTWLKDLVATQFVLNNETFGHGPLKTITTRSIDVPIMLNAARELSVVLLTWREEQGIPTAYPISGYTVRLQVRYRGTPVDSGVLTGVSDALGFVTFRSDPTDPRRVFWAGATVRYRVEPPAYVNEPDDPKWRDWLRTLRTEFVEVTYGTPTRRSHFAYFPDEEPTHWAIDTIRTWFDDDGYCFGLCTFFNATAGRTHSKPYVITVNYAAVTVRALDFNGRPLAGAFVELVDRPSGRISAWSYTANATWSARPMDDRHLYQFHRGRLLEPRPIGGAGYTAIMNLTFGAWNYDGNDDDRIDAFGVRNPLLQIVRVYWLSTDRDAANAIGNLLPVWPFRDESAPLPRHAKVYDSDFDETDNTAKTLVVPDSFFEIRLPDGYTDYNDPISRGVHRDVTTHVFDLKIVLNYEGKALPEDIKDRLTVRLIRKQGEIEELRLTFRDRPGGRVDVDSITVNRLPRGTYEVLVLFTPRGDVPILRIPLAISTVNVGEVRAEGRLPFTDLSFEVTDMRGRPLTLGPGAVSLDPREFISGEPRVAGNIVTITALYTGGPVTMTVRYSSPLYGREVSVSMTDSAEGIKNRLLGGRTLQLPVDDVVVTAVDAQGRPVGGAVVAFGPVSKTTGADGRAVFELVPLGTEASPQTYTLRVTVERVEVFREDVRVSVANKQFSVLAQLFRLTVRVLGELGQGLQGATVKLMIVGGNVIATGTADAGGAVTFERLAPRAYDVEALYKGYSGRASVSLEALRRGDVAEIRLPVY
ncbi:MAG: carboxypeptidase-like regulatory domain-containing protein, partial [Anaerolineae bacterium]|uniref:MSCRAMM family protein n=1 Tax=Thermoflexus sp. TaxID=1969742 RepID=UPI0025E6E58B